MSDSRPIRVILAKTGLDGHDRGVKVLAKGLLNDGMEVVYLGSHQSEAAVAQAAADEDADVVGLSILSGEHLVRAPKMATALTDAGLDDVVFVIGGCIPRQHIPRLKEIGVDEIFEAATMVQDIASWNRSEVGRRRSTDDRVEAASRSDV